MRQLALAVAPLLTQPALVGPNSTQPFGRLLGLFPRGLGGLPLHLFLAGQQPEPAALLQPAGRGYGTLRGGDKAVPAPQVAFDGDQSLTGPEEALQSRTIGALYQADLLQTAHELLGTGHMRVQRRRTLRQSRVGLGSRIERPTHRRLGRDRGVQIVAQRGGERQLVALRHLDRIQHRRQAAVAGGLQQLRQRLHFGPEPAGGQPHLGCRLALGGGVGGCRLYGFLRNEGLRLDGGDVGHEFLAGLGRVFQLGGIRRPADDLARLRFQRHQLPLELEQALLALAQLSFRALALRTRLGRRGGQLAQPRFRRGEGGCRLVVGDKRLLLEGAGQLVGIGERLLLGLQPRQGVLGLGDQRLLAGAIAHQLLNPGLQLFAPIGVALRLALEVLLLDLEAVQNRTLGSFLVAQGLDAVGGLCLRPQCLGFGLGGPPDFFQGGGKVGLPALDLLLRLGPAQVQDHSIELADLGRQLLVAAGLAGLTLQAFDLRIELPQNVVEAGQVALGRAQAQLRLVAATMQTGDPGRVLQDAPAVLGFGIDDLGDLTLPHQRRRARAGGRVLEQDAYVARAHLPAVDAIGRTRLAFDAASDIECVVAVELGGGLAVAVVDLDRNFRVVARGARVAAAEDDVVHRRGAHALVRGLAHDPAQRFQQIGLAAAVGSDDAGQAFLDQQVGRLDKGFEANEPEPVDMHRTSNPWN